MGVDKPRDGVDEETLAYGLGCITGDAVDTNDEVNDKELEDDEKTENDRRPAWRSHLHSPNTWHRTRGQLW